MTYEEVLKIYNSVKEPKRWILKSRSIMIKIYHITTDMKQDYILTYNNEFNAWDLFGLPIFIDHSISEDIVIKC